MTLLRRKKGSCRFRLVERGERSTLLLAKAEERRLSTIASAVDALLVLWLLLLLC
jgi:hypothetical protein